MVDFLVIGLGNPGPQYRDTRHNVGFRVIEALARRWKVCPEGLRFQGLFATASLKSLRVGLLKPLTYMNLSGQSVREAVGRLRLRLERVLIVSDDTNLPLGKLRLRPKGSDGGHKGLRSVLQALGTQEVPRLRVGIGPPPQGVDLVAFVLSPFEPEEAPIIADAVERAAEAVQIWLTEGIEAAMQRFNA